MHLGTLSVERAYRRSGPVRQWDSMPGQVLQSSGGSAIRRGRVEVPSPLAVRSVLNDTSTAVTSPGVAARGAGPA